MRGLLTQRAILASGIFGLLVFSEVVGNTAILNVQILGRGTAPTGAADPAPSPYIGAGVIGVDRDFWNGVQADAFGHPLTIRLPEKMVEADGKTTNHRFNLKKGAANQWSIKL